MRLSEDHRAFRDTVRRFVDTEINPHVDAWEAAGRAPLHTIFGKAAAVGLLGLEYDPAYGGEGADHSFQLVAAEEYGRIHAAGVGMALGVQAMMATPSLHRYGSDELKRRYLAPAVAGAAVTAIAVTEPDTGSDVARLRTRAVRDGDDWVITGRKVYITNGAQADWVCLLARTSDEGGHRGMSQIVVPTGTPGFSVGRTFGKLGNRCSDTAELILDGVRVPVANTIGAEGRGFQQQMEQFVVERMFAAYTTAGQCAYALERTRAFVRDRTVFGRPLAERQYVAFRLAELQAAVDLLRSHNLATCEALMAGEDVTRMATVAKLTAGRLVREVADWCLQFHGGTGYLEETWTARFLRDTRITSIGAGADEVMLQVLARLDGLP
ncbi:acyl-CoA dehydrogenase family protein [Spirilliplanes yamanashiensis]|uniref:Acyl-CoA dehydrogenase n=1 Tax=Spirilliplanes yamanashiensis TaxID=42233 RepID=A0A8J3YAB7_9ACTN|nr:acyl-CoA dehydrogenase family protein [Spirilliplanes yamanashiensis]MDP9818140.1 citronellyl-CoA dehydrogenase [Spirilliplanes yamanashiensis]GIJ04951.1 acyl-CoA dehydrogenase [Spirilliplanes yamanashiensis]